MQVTRYSGGKAEVKSTLLQRDTASWSAVQLNMIGSLSCRAVQKGAREASLGKKKNNKS